MIEWREIPGLSGQEITRCGQVRRWVTLTEAMTRLAEPVSVRPRLGHNGYFKFNCCRDGRPGTMELHRALALTFIGDPPSPEHHVDHIDRDRNNNALGNLRWVSSSESNFNRSKLRKCKHLIPAVRWARVIDGKTYAQIAREFGIDHKLARIYANAAA